MDEFREEFANPYGASQARLPRRRHRAEGHPETADQRPGPARTQAGGHAPEGPREHPAVTMAPTDSSEGISRRGRTRSPSPSTTGKSPSTCPRTRRPPKRPPSSLSSAPTCPTGSGPPRHRPVSQSSTSRRGPSRTGCGRSGSVVSPETWKRPGVESRRSVVFPVATAFGDLLAAFLSGQPQ